MSREKQRELEEINRPMNEKLFSNIEKQYQEIAKLKAESEQIEEMANYIEKSHWKIVQDFMGCHINSDEIAEYLYNQGYCKQSEVLIIPEMSDDDIQRAIDFIKKSRLQIIPDDKAEAWISVDERLPEDGETVLTISSEAKMEVCFYKTEWEGIFQQCHGLIKIYNITHWMPLPEAPKMKGGAE